MKGHQELFGKMMIKTCENKTKQYDTGTMGGKLSETNDVANRLHRSMPSQDYQANFPKTCIPREPEVDLVRDDDLDLSLIKIRMI